MSVIRLAIVGCTGRVGGRLIHLAAADQRFAIEAAVTRVGHPAVGQDAGVVAGGPPVGVAVSDRLNGRCDAVIEFSNTGGARMCADWCRKNRVPLVSATTGLSPVDHEAFAETARIAPVLWAPNMSVGANLLMRISAEVAAALGETYDIEIVEAHHKGKRDAPSGTALAILNAICGARGDDPPTVAVVGRTHESQPRRAGEIGIHSVRMGDIVGEHEIHFSTAGESVTLRHRAASRDTFAAGALRAATWLIGRPAGLYTMQHLLGPSQDATASNSLHDRNQPI